MQIRRMTAAVITLVLAGPAFSQQANDYAAQARLGWAAFTCRTYAMMASINEPTGDADRLFQIG